MFMKRIGEVKEGLMNRYRSKIRERAITQAKVRIALSQKPFEDFTEDEIEIVVRAEEDNVKTSFKQSAAVALLIALGLS